MRISAIFILILFLPLASSLTNIQPNSTILISRGLNSNITFSIEVNATLIQIQNISIFIQNATFVRGGSLQVCDVNLTTANTTLDSANFCPSGGGGGGGGEWRTPPQRPKLHRIIEISEVEINYTILILLWLIILLIFLILSFFLDRYKKENLIGLKTQIVLTIVSALVLFLIGMSSMGIIFSYEINTTLIQINFAKTETKIVMGILTGILFLWFLFLWLIIEKSRYSKI